MADLFLKRGDTAPALTAQLTDNGEGVDLADAESVQLVLRRIHGDVVIAGVTVEVLDPEDVQAPHTDELGWVQYDWAEGDTDVAGGYFAEFPTILAGGVKATFPNDRHFTVAILDDLEVEPEEEGS